VLQDIVKLIATQAKDVTGCLSRTAPAKVLEDLNLKSRHKMSPIDTPSAICDCFLSMFVLNLGEDSLVRIDWLH
jgi:hypothetical protein